MLGLGNWVDNGKILSCKSPSFHFFFVLVAFNFHPFSSLYLLILLNLGLILLFGFLLLNVNSICTLFRPVPLFLNYFSVVFSNVGNSAMFCLLRLSITLREIWASNSHTNLY